MYAYCGNNPVVRADIDGDFWHIVIGAAAGAVIGAVGAIISGGDLTEVLVSVAFGAASGALAATGLCATGMAIASAGLSMAENATKQIIDNEGFDNFNVGDMLIDGVIGSVTAGRGTGTKHMMNLGTQTVKRTANATIHKGIKNGAKEFVKAGRYYIKNTVNYYDKFGKNFLNELADETISASIERNMSSTIDGCTGATIATVTAGALAVSATVSTPDYNSFRYRRLM